ncbi:MAG: hypothetical protein K2L77_09815 [Muribaculaceae bacterium]|nr:hypothetical protein [Muribaculaceae bacterium]
MKASRKFAILMVLGAAAAACNSTGCLDNGSALPLAGFYSSATADPISVDSVEIAGVGAPGDSVLEKAHLALSKVYLPMNPSASVTRWAFIYRQKQLQALGITDTISFDYEAIPYFASEECGAMYIYRITGVRHTDNFIDSITLTDSLITNVEAERIKIFFRTAQEEPTQ